MSKPQETKMDKGEVCTCGCRPRTASHDDGDAVDAGKVKPEQGKGALPDTAGNSSRARRMAVRKRQASA